MWSEAGEDMRGLLIDLTHHRDLEILLVRIGLVDTEGVLPNVLAVC
jgi:hypothetical protein